MEHTENGAKKVPQQKDDFIIPSSFASQAEEIHDPEKQDKVEFQTT